jgi:hypothetical protein
MSVRVVDTSSKNHKINTGLKVIIIFSIAVLVVFLVILSIVQLVESKNYTLTFNDDLTYTDGSMILVVDNNDKNSIKKILVYGFNNNSEYKISSSHLMDQSHQVVKSSDITFNNKSEFLLNNIQNEPVVIDVSINNIQLGESSGRIIFTGNHITSVPIKITTEPLVVRALLWVLIGVLISVIIWELINQLTTKHYRDIYKGDIESYKELHHKVLRHEKRWTGNGWKRQTLYIIGSAGFAMSVGIISLFNNDYVTGQRVIDPNEIIVLIGIGLGTGSIKEFVDRSF